MREGLHKIVPTDDTIVAVSTPFGRSGIGVIRLSGGLAESGASRFLKTEAPLVHRQATRGLWVDEEGVAIDEVVATLFRNPNSYTGEDVLEISAHGNPIILRRIVDTVRAVGIRPATAGEFTLRAVLNGKMDLIQAEGVRAFIDAQTEAQARTALLQMGGTLSNRILPTKERLVDIIAHLEAGIDFADDDVRPPDGRVIAERIIAVHDDLVELQKTYSYGKLLSDGLRLAIVGKPNVGKSSLFNRLVGAERAIVTSVPGTTRDVLSECVHLDGIPLRFSDTAGLRDTVDPVESIGVIRTIETLSDADLVLVVLDGNSKIDEWDRKILSRVERTTHHIVINKSDLPPAGVEEFSGLAGAIRLSAKTGEGLDSLEEAIREFLGSRGEATSGSVLTSARQEEHVSEAIQALDKGSLALLQGTPHEMVLLDVYEALSNLNELTGEVVTDDILGRIFSTFCVGK
ncbi:MAG TPA: tRNA uridine-5-carboxymethylaminomethyl(34) synthesis GTPase MnmE [Terriglobia bacterium]|nr:tRNA uridine-5-carboxymethylaminomethyl(34) synthesis GTPase MnmE [Terriglobia bacterium]